VIGAVASVAVAIGLAAHPYHVATGEADLNPETGRLEIAMAFDPVDLKRGLTLFAGEDVNLDDPEAVGPVFERHIAGTWWYRPIDGDDGGEETALISSEPSFVGLEFEGQTAWVYFTVAFPGDPASHEMGVWSLMEAEPALEIGLRLRLDPTAKPRSLVFKSDARWRPLAEQPPEGE